MTAEASDSPSDIPRAWWSDGTEADLGYGDWDDLQPDLSQGNALCVRVNNLPDDLYPWAMESCAKELPFICQTNACVTGKYNNIITNQCLSDW